MLVMKDLVSDEYLSKKYPTRGSFVVQGKTVNIPAIYKGRGLTAVFPISYKKATDLIHSKDLKPARLSFTKALLSITAFDFSESPIGPYTELAYAIPVLYKPKLNIPLLPALLNKHWKGFGYYVLDLMQSTEIAIEHGNQLTGYPHNNNLIDVRFVKNHSTLKIVASDKFGDIINIQGLVTESYKNVFQTYATYFEKNGSFSEIQMDVYGDETKMRDVNLQFGKSKLADIASAVVSTRPVQASYYPHVIEINPVTLKHL